MSNTNLTKKQYEELKNSLPCLSTHFAEHNGVMKWKDWFLADLDVLEALEKPFDPKNQVMPFLEKVYRNKLQRRLKETLNIKKIIDYNMKRKHRLIENNKTNKVKKTENVIMAECGFELSRNKNLRKVEEEIQEIETTLRKYPQLIEDDEGHNSDTDQKQEAEMRAKRLAHGIYDHIYQKTNWERELEDRRERDRQNPNENL